MQRVTSAADALAAARSLGPALRERAAQCDTLREVPEDTIEDMQRSGLFQLMVPRRFGGAGLGFTETRLDRRGDRRGVRVERLGLLRAGGPQLVRRFVSGAGAGGGIRRVRAR